MGQVGKVNVFSSLFQACHKPFGGPGGALFLTFLLPEVVYLLNNGCNAKTCVVHNFPSLIPNIFLFLDPVAYLLVIGWLLFQYGLARLPIGEVHYGHPIRNGTRLPYRCNGTYALVITLLVMGLMTTVGIDVTIVYDRLESILMSAIVITFILSTFLYHVCKTTPEYRLADGVYTRNPIYNFFVGRELHPRFGQLDVKQFFETRPGLIGLVVLNLVFLVRTLETTESPSISMVMTVAFQILWVMNTLYSEVSLLSGVSIVHEAMGFQYMFRTFIWLPFTYAITTRYLMEHTARDNVIVLFILFIINVVGLMQCRIASRQSTLGLRRYGIDSMWWRTNSLIISRNRLFLKPFGPCRNPTYLGELLLVVAWSIICGSRHVPTYLMPIYIFIVTVFRVKRENSILSKKYSRKWREFCERVPYALLPRIY